MYRVKNDKRVMKSVESICEGLRTCLKDKSFNAISVNELASAAGVSRATFYRIFDAPTDILAYLCDELIAEVVRFLVSSNNYSPSQIRSGSLKIWLDNADLLSAIYSSGKSDILKDSLQKYLNSGFFMAMGVITDEEMDYLQETLSSILDAVMLVWLRHNKKESAEEILALYSKIASIIGIIFN